MFFSCRLSSLCHGGSGADKGRKVSVLVAGGSGFYLQSFLTPVVDDIEVTREIREEVEQIYANDHLVGIVARLKELNPDGVGTLDTLNPRQSHEV